MQSARMLPRQGRGRQSKRGFRFLTESFADSFASEDLFQQAGGLGCRIIADLLFFLAKHIEETVQRFAYDVLVEIEAAGQRRDAWFALPGLPRATITSEPTVGKTRSVLSSYEWGKRNPDLVTAMSLSTLYDVPLNRLFPQQIVAISSCT